MFTVKGSLGKANIPLTIRFTDPIYESLTKLAARNDISVNQLVLQCCQYALDSVEDDHEAQS